MVAVVTAVADVIVMPMGRDVSLKIVSIMAGGWTIILVTPMHKEALGIFRRTIAGAGVGGSRRRTGLEGTLGIGDSCSGDKQ